MIGFFSSVLLIRQDEWVVCKVFNKKGEAKTAKAADVDAEYSAVTTPNASSVVDAGEGAGDFTDSMFTIDPLYIPNSDEYTSNQPPAKTTTTTNNNSAPPPYNADYYYPSVPTTAGSFNLMSNYSLTNAPSNAQTTTAMASSVPATSGSSWQHMLMNTAPHGMMGRRSYDVNRHEQQAIMVRALGGVVGAQNFGEPAKGLQLPSSAVTAGSVLPQQSKLGSYDDGEFPYGNYDLASAAMNGRPAAANNLGARFY